MGGGASKAAHEAPKGRGAHGRAGAAAPSAPPASFPISLQLNASSIPSPFWSATLPALARRVVVFNAHTSKLKQVPDDVFEELVELKLLDLRENMLSRIPPSIGRASELTVVRLSQNNLTELPRELGHCSNLVELDVSHNNITSLPDTLSMLSALQVLLMDHNKLRVFPLDDLIKMTQLHTLTVVAGNTGDGGTLETLPEAVWRAGDAKVLAYVQRKARAASARPEDDEALREKQMSRKQRSIAAMPSWMADKKGEAEEQTANKTGKAERDGDGDVNEDESETVVAEVHVVRVEVELSSDTQTMSGAQARAHAESEAKVVEGARRAKEEQAKVAEAERARVEAEKAKVERKQSIQAAKEAVKREKSLLKEKEKERRASIKREKSNASQRPKGSFGGESVPQYTPETLATPVEADEGTAVEVITEDAQVPEAVVDSIFSPAPTRISIRRKKRTDSTMSRDSTADPSALAVVATAVAPDDKPSAAISFENQGLM